MDPIVSKLFENVGNITSKVEFIMSLGKVLGEDYTIDELLELLNSHEVGKENEWITRIDDFFKGMDEKMLEYKDEFEGFKDTIRTYLCMFSVMPKALCLFRSVLTFQGTCLQYANITRIKDLVELVENERQTGQTNMFLDLFTKVCMTVQYLALKTFIQNAVNFSTHKPIIRVEYPQNIGRKKYDESAWNEFNDFMEDFGVFENEEAVGCYLM